MSHPTVCPECNAPMREEWQGSLYTGWHCSTPWVHELQADRDALCARVAELEADKNIAWDRGFYCAVAILLQECGDDGTAKSLYKQGGNPSNADDEDKALFIEYRFMEESHDPQV